jgi:hypothetical protein
MVWPHASNRSDGALRQAWLRHCVSSECSGQNRTSTKKRRPWRARGYKQLNCHWWIRPYPQSQSTAAVFGSATSQAPNWPTTRLVSGLVQVGLLENHLGYLLVQRIGLRNLEQGELERWRAVPMLRSCRGEDTRMSSSSLRGQRAHVWLTLPKVLAWHSWIGAARLEQSPLMAASGANRARRHPVDAATGVMMNNGSCWVAMCSWIEGRGKRHDTRVPIASAYPSTPPGGQLPNVASTRDNSRGLAVASQCQPCRARRCAVSLGACTSQWQPAWARHQQRPRTWWPCLRGQTAKTATYTAFKAERKSLMITVGIQEIPLTLSQQHQLSNRAVAMTRGYPDRKMEVCQDGFIVPNAGSRTKRQPHVHSALF